MNYYEVTIYIRMGDGLDRIALRIIVKAQNRIEACTEVIHAYRLAVPEEIKKLDLWIGTVYDITALIEDML